MKHYLKSVASYSMVGGFGLLFLTAMTGCEQKPKDGEQPFGEVKPQAGQEQQGQFLVIQETAPGKYKVVEQYPTNSGESRAVLKDLNGTERLISNEELKKMAEAEAAKVEAGTSNLAKSPEAQAHSGGMSLGETILAGAAGALIGGYIANKLFSNPNFQANQRAVAPNAISRPATPMSPSAKPSAASPQSGYFKQGAAPATAKPASSPQSGFFKSSSPSGGSSFGG